jgi:D-amino-acid dehydrogenase
MQVAVIGGGVIGVSTAYFLAAAGHQVVVIERYGNVAQETSYGNAGLVSASQAVPWAAPGMPRKILSRLLKSETSVLLKPTLDAALWRWVRKWLPECDPERFRINTRRMQRVAVYSQHLMRQVRDHYDMRYDQTSGLLQLFRTPQDVEGARSAMELLVEAGIEHRLIDTDAARMIEPALGVHTPLAAALHFPADESGNCPLFSRHLKNITQQLGAEFHFNSTVKNIEPNGERLRFHIDDRSFTADAVVLAAGIDSMELLEPLGIHVPLYPVKGYSATAFIKNYDQAPLASLFDETYKVAITRLGSRIRVAGTAELGSRTLHLHGTALRTLAKVGDDWFPDAANYNTSTFWCGARPMLADETPLIGPTPIRNLYLNIGHGSSGWTMAAGCGKIVSDLVSGQTPDIDMEGLTLARYGKA